MVCMIPREMRLLHNFWLTYKYTARCTAKAASFSPQKLHLRSSQRMAAIVSRGIPGPSPILGFWCYHLYFLITPKHMANTQHFFWIVFCCAYLAKFSVHGVQCQGLYLANFRFTGHHHRASC